MYCNKCGKQINDDSKFCPFCGSEINNFEPTKVESITTVTPKSDNTKIYCVLSYIGILWLIGLIVNPEKNDPKVRFHVGQGIILTIASCVVSIVRAILIGIIHIITKLVINVGFGYMGGLNFGNILTALVNLVFAAASVTVFVIAIIGIVNAVNGNQKPLPIIGNLAFYK